MRGTRLHGPTDLVDGTRVRYHGTLDDRARSLIARGLEQLRAGHLRRWHLCIRGSGGCCIDMPAELDAAAVRAAVLQCPAYGTTEPKRLTVELADRPSGHNAWIRVLGLGGCIDIDEVALQPDLFPELVARDEVAA